MANGATEEDEAFLAFKERISHDPDQVLIFCILNDCTIHIKILFYCVLYLLDISFQILRYQLNGEPLFVSAVNQPQASDIPPCSCGRPRRFEFQVNISLNDGEVSNLAFICPNFYIVPDHASAVDSPEGDVTG